MISTSTTTPQPWLRRRRNQIVVVIVIVVIAVSLFVYLTPSPPPTPNQAALNKTIKYFVSAYNFTTGLVAVTPGNTTFWLYSDNYLSALAIQRYDPSNQSTANFALALSEALGSYAATLPSTALVSEYTALNSTSASYSCPIAYQVSWSTTPGNIPEGRGSAAILTTAYNGAPSCASQNYADSLLLMAIQDHRAGNSTGASANLAKAAADFNGKGFDDFAYTNTQSPDYGQYQTYKLALYVIASTCLGGSTTDTTLPAVESLLKQMQDNSTGGFYTGYIIPGNHGTTIVNTETTALGALALESMINPSAAC